MGFRFRKSISIIPGVRINISRGGFSTTIGGRGSSVNIGPRGNYFNASIPGSGLSYRQRISPAAQKRNTAQRISKYESGPLPTAPFMIPGTHVDFGSAEASELTSWGLGNLKELISSTRSRKTEIELELRKAQSQLFWNKVRTILLSLTIIGLIFVRTRKQMNARSYEVREDIQTLEENLENTKVIIDFDLESEVASPFRRMEAAFEAMSQSQAKWCIASKYIIDCVKARSWAGTIIKRVPTQFSRTGCSLVDTQIIPFLFGTLQQRSTVYLYPGFIMVIGARNFAVIDIMEIQTTFAVSRFQESDRLPADAEIIGQAWAKSNKDGSRDRRFNSNRQIPIARYGSWAPLSKLIFI